MFTQSSIFTGSKGQITRVTGTAVSLGAYPTYREAQAVVDTLADRGFAVETTQIIGSDLQMIEQVTGRQTWPRAVLGGVAQGAWFGLFLGLVLSILTATSVLESITWGVGWGVVFWGAWAAMAYGSTGGCRDFTSQATTVPTTFEVLVESESLNLARSTLVSGR